MHHFHYQGDELFCEDVAVSDIAAEVGTPFYLYSRATIERHFGAFDDAFAHMPHLVAFSAKPDIGEGTSLFPGMNPVGEDSLVGPPELTGSSQDSTAVDPYREPVRGAVLLRQNLRSQFSSPVERNGGGGGECLVDSIFTDACGSNLFHS